jgi:peptide/nickel transport system substrate-binding protein
MHHRPKIATLRSAIVAAAVALCATPVFAGPKDNSLVVAISTDFVEANPAVGTLGTDMPILYVMYDRLIQFNPDLTPSPGLATDWTWSDDKKTLTLHLRKGVKFQDGTDFNADAVKKSIEFFVSKGRNKDLNKLDHIDVIDPYTVSITMKEVNSQLPGILAERAGLIMSPTALAKWGDDFSQHPVGTGPYQFKEHIVGKSVTFTKFKDYWNPDAAKLDKIEFRVIQSATSAVAAMMTGQIDYMSSVDPVNIPAMKANPNVRVEIEPTIGYGVFKEDTSLAPIDKKEVRQAFSMSIDRDALAKSIYGAVPTSGTVLPVPRDYWPSTDSVQDSVKYDPAKAKQMLADAGYPDGATVSVCINSTAGMPQPQLKVIDILKEQMKPAGFTLDVTQAASTSGCTPLMNKEHVMDMILLMWSGRPDPAITYTQMMASDNLLPGSIFNVANRDYGADKLLIELNNTFNQKDQKPIYDKLNAIFVDQYPFMPLYGFVNPVAYKKGLVGEQPNRLGRPYVRVLYWEK